MGEDSDVSMGVTQVVAEMRSLIGGRDPGRPTVQDALSTETCERWVTDVTRWLEYAGLQDLIEASTVVGSDAVARQRVATAEIGIASVLTKPRDLHLFRYGSGTIAERWKLLLEEYQESDGEKTQRLRKERDDFRVGSECPSDAWYRWRQCSMALGGASKSDEKADFAVFCGRLPIRLRQMVDSHPDMTISAILKDLDKAGSSADSAMTAAAAPSSAPPQGRKGHANRGRAGRKDSSQHRDRRCYLCRKPGHLAHDCHDFEVVKKSHHQSRSAQEGEYTNWILDTGASLHLTDRKGNVSNRSKLA